ncbi:MAG TPA: MFS transporter [Chloroflexi bacterium]|nr:MFS transporter [Chloroflexota bacterium]
MADRNVAPTDADDGVSATFDGRFQTGHVLSISFAHAANDTYTSFLAPLLPTLIGRLSLSNTQAGLLALIQSSPSLIQPMIGHLADRASLRYLVILGPALAATMMSLLGIAPGYAVAAFLVLIAGLSSASLHAAAPAMAGRLSGLQLGRGVGLWNVGGYLGLALGPFLVAGTVKFLSVEGTPWLMLGGWLASAILYIRLRKVALHTATHALAAPWRKGWDLLRPLLPPMAGLTLTRALLYAASVTFLPTLLTEQGSDIWRAGLALSTVQVASAMGAFAAGSLSDRFGRRSVILASIVVTSALLVTVVLLRGWTQMAVLLALGASSPATHVVLMAMVQEHCPDNRALANGVFLSLAFLSESVGAVVLGALADLFGLRIAFIISAAVLLAGLPLVFMLPSQAGPLASRDVSVSD